MKSGNGKAGELGDKESIHLGHCGALDRLMARSGWEGEEWLRSFAAKSRRIGEALGSFRDDVSAEMSLHQKRFGQGFSPLSKLHSVFMCQAAASTLANAMQKSDLEPLVGSEGPDEQERRELFLRVLSRSYSELNDSEQIAWAARLSRGLAERWGDDQEQRVRLAQRISESKSFTESARSMIIAGIANTALAISDDLADHKAKNHAPYAPTSNEASDSLLDRDHRPNDFVGEILRHASGLFISDPSARLEARFYALCQAYAYDHPLLMRRYPNGLFDGATLLLPATQIASGVGGEKVFERAMKALSQASREALGVEESGKTGVSRVEQGGLREILISCGLLRTAQALADSGAEQERAEAGFRSSDVAGAARQACLEGLGFPPSPPLDLSPQSSLDADLREAAWLGGQERINSLIQAGADPLSTSSEGMSALMLAAATGHVKRVQRLAPLSEVALRDPQGKSARDYAELSGGADSALVRWLDAFVLSISERDGLVEATQIESPALTEKAAPKHRI